MGKRFNDKARLRPSTSRPSESSIHTEKNQKLAGKCELVSKEGSSVLEKQKDEYQTVSEAIPMMLPGKKKKVEKKRNKQESKRVKLTKNQTRKLKQIIEKKKKKAKRSDILSSLSQFQVSEKELSMYKTISTMGQKDAKNSSEILDLNVKDFLSPPPTCQVTRGKKKGKKLKLTNKKVPDISVMKTDEEVLEEDSDSSDDGSDNDDSDDQHQEDCDQLTNSNNCEDQDQHLSQNSEVKEVKVDQNISEKKITASLPPVHAQPKPPAPVRKIVDSKPAVYVELKRTAEIQASRVLLPILAEEQMTMETIQDNSVIVICGETGSGKTTQVPQFLYEAGFGSQSPNSGMIGITEPRRVAAVSMSKRVACEMNLSTSIVSYQIRYEGNVTDNTKVKFMTDGVLLKEMETDFLLNKYSVIIIDEAHERSVFTDILIGLLSRAVPLRNKQGNPMKLIIMSATLRIEDFLENKRLFPSPPPLLKIDSRQYPVTVHFNKRTPLDYVTEAYNKVCKIHRTLKPGGVLVFVTGQNEVHSICRKLRKAFPPKDKSAEPLEQQTKDTHPGRKRKAEHLDKYSASSEPFAEFDNEDLEDDFYDDDLTADNQLSSEEDMDDAAYDSANEPALPLYVLPLYSLLSTDKQAKVFEPCPEGYRLCVVATNVAETSLTIPGIKYVVDSGKVKARFYDKLTGVSSFRIAWASKASANQRAGRAGRVEPGHCYRLYSSAVFQHDFEEFSEAEIIRKPADDLLLLMKNMCIDRVGNFPFPTPPDPKSLKAAENLLIDLGALEKQKTKKGQYSTTVTLLGRSMAQLPISPRYGKMILLAHQQDCMQYMIIIVAALTVKEIFSDDVKVDDENETTTNSEDDAKRKRIMLTQARRKWAGTGEISLLGDMMVVLRAVGACEFAGCTERFCKENGLRYKAMVEIRKLRAQLSRAVNSLNTGVELCFDPKINPPNDVQAKVMRQILLTCLGDRVARKIPQTEIKDLSLKNAYQSCSTDDPVFIHPQSAFFAILPEYVVYQEIIETSKLYMRGLTSIDQDWLPVFASYKCSFSKPLESFPPRYDSKTGKMKCHMTSTFGPHSWVLPAQELDYPRSIDRVKWFARSFLEGKVCGGLKEFVPYLLTPASVMVKTWAKLQPRTEVLLKEFLCENISDRQSLLSSWKANENTLLKPYLQWVPESLHEQVRKKWPPF